MSSDGKLKNVHPVAESAFSISGASGLYDRARPSYPDSALSHIFAAAERIRSSSSSKEGIDVVELGPGTGIFTRRLLQPPQAHAGIIRSITGIEPAPGMREGFEKAMSAADHNGVQVSIKPGSFTSIPLPDGSADMICIAQAFHWAHPEYDATASEFARILRSGGYLVLIWNLEDRDRAEWVARVRDAYEEFEDGTPQYRHMYWKALFDADSYKSNFQPEGEVQFESTERGIETTEQGVVDRVVSKSYITNLTDEKKAEVKKRVRKVLTGGNIDDGCEKPRVWVDTEKGVFEYPYKTDMYIIKRN